MLTKDKQEIFNRRRYKGLVSAAEDFSLKVKAFKNVIEVGITGSLAAEDEYPNDIDIVLFLNNFDNISMIAKCARQISSIYHGWEVFVILDGFKYTGRICHKKACPIPEYMCHSQKCDKIPYISDDPDFVFNPQTFLSSPYKMFWSHKDTSLWEAWREKLNISEIKQYEKLIPIQKTCIECGESLFILLRSRKVSINKDLCILNDVMSAD